MSKHQSHEPAEGRVTRRALLRAGTAAVALSGAGAVAGAAPCAAAAVEAAKPEWRNRKPGMAYRMLGRTGMMVSEVVCGGDPVHPGNWRHLELALDMGLNYLDMAPQYGDGECERAFGQLLAAAPGRRDQVFLTTKVSGFTQMRERMYREIFDGLPGGKRDDLVQRAMELRRQRRVEQPGYFLTYFPGQQGQFDPAYLRVAMMPEYSERVEGSDAFKRYVAESLEGSLKRVGTDHFDLLMCPHGANTPEELDCPQISEAFQELKKQGKVRFLGVTAHNDPAGLLRAAADGGQYDAVMLAYNVINGGYLEDAIRHAHGKGVGIIAMKAAHAIATHHQQLQPVPQWRIDKINRVIPGDMKPPMKAYLWALQNPGITAVISNLWDETYVRENLSLAGKKVELQAA
ncbi:MAG: aldo/keto reductase [Armatimonadota bacterium]